MPPAIIGVIAIVALEALELGTILTAVLSAVISIGIGFISRALAPDPGGGDFSGGFAAAAQKRTQTIRTSTPAKSVVVGEAKKGGALTFYEATGNNQFHHLVITLGEGPVQKIDPVWLGDIPVYADQLDAGGNVTVGRFAGKVRIKTHLGDAAQVADTDLVSETSVGSNFRGRGVAYVYVRIDWDREVFPNGLPNISALLKGYKFEDSRTSTTAWTPNPALAIRGFWINAGWETGLATAKFDDTFTNAAANICEEFVTTKSVAHTISNVDFANDLIEFADTRLCWQTGDRVQLTTAGTLPGGLALLTDYFVIVTRPLKNADRAIAVKLASSYANALAETAITITDAGTGTHTGTKNAEPRYTANGVIELGEGNDSSDITEELLSAMAGRWTASAKITMYAGAYTAPAVTLDENDVIGRLKIQTKIARRDRFNRLLGIFVSPINDWQPSEYPLVKNATAETQDGKPILRKLDLPFTSRTNTAQRLAKIDLNRMLFERTVEGTYSLKALQLLAGDTVAMDNTRRGWSGMPFEITSWRLVPVQDRAGESAIGVVLQQRETASSVFDFTAVDDEISVPAVNESSLPSPFNPPAPTSVVVSTIEFLTDSGTKLSHIKIAWTKPADWMVQQEGRIETQFKRSADATWTPLGLVDGSDESVLTPPVEADVNYDTRIRSVGHLGVAASTSAWQTISNYTVGSPGAGASSQRDYGLITDTSPSEFFDRGGITAAVDKNLDYGTIT